MCAGNKIMNMQKRQIIFILAILSMIACLAMPVMAADEPPRDAATIYYNLAEKTLLQGDYEGAVALFDQALASNTTMIKLSDGLLYTYRDKGYALIQMENYTSAIETLDTGLAAYPKDAMLWNNKGYALYKLGKYSDAVAAYDKAIALDPEYTGVLINKGDALFAAGQYTDAIKAYNKSLESNPGNSNTTAKLAAAQKAAESAVSPVTLLLIIVVIAAAGIAGYYFMRRKTVAGEPQKKKPAKK